MLTAFLPFLAQYISLIGWSSLMYTAYRVGRFFTKVEHRFEALEFNINKAMTNELPHIQAAMTGVLQAIIDLRDDLHFLIQGFSRR